MASIEQQERLGAESWTRPGETGVGGDVLGTAVWYPSKACPCACRNHRMLWPSLGEILLRTRWAQEKHLHWDS